MKDISLGTRRVGPKCEPYFIADIGANHDGSLERAYRLIELAKESGADCAKFQNFKAKKIVSDKGFRSLGGQVSHQANWRKSVYEVYDEASLPYSWTPLLKEKCDEVGIEYCTSPYDFASVDDCDPYLNFFKIGSGDISWPAMIEYIASKGKPVCLATGAAALEEVDRAMQAASAVNKNIILMQCNTNYTAEQGNFHHINLNVLRTYADRYPEAVLGLSDHTKGHVTVLGAIALGARVIEKHFTDDNLREGPDHKFATTPDEWRAMVDDSLKLYHALGDGIKRVEANELDTCVVQKRGLYVTRRLCAGDVLSDGDLEPLRPRSNDGFEPWEADSIVGLKLKVDVEEGAMLKRGDVE